MPLNPSRPEGFDTALICERGHVATSSLELAPHKDAPFCQQCGKPTIRACPKCEAPIQGLDRNTLSVRPYQHPAHCKECGTPFPWQERALQEAKRITDQIAELTPEEREELQESLEQITTDSPDTEYAAQKVGGFIGRLRGPTGEVVKQLAINIGTEAAKVVIRAAAGG